MSGTLMMPGNYLTLKHRLAQAGAAPIECRRTRRHTGRAGVNPAAAIAALVAPARALGPLGLIFPPISTTLPDVQRTLSLLMLTAAGLSTPLRAAEIHNLAVTEQRGSYRVSFDAVVNAPHEAVYAVIADPGRWHQLSAIVTASEAPEKLPGTARQVRVTFQDCILIFCQTIHKSEALQTFADGNIETLAIPEQSDFSYAHEQWRISAAGQGTRILYRAEMTPSFYVPPLVGSYLLKTKIRSLLLHVTANLEILARP